MGRRDILFVMAMSIWNSPRQLAELKELYDRMLAEPASVSDEELLAKVASSLWPTDCWTFAENAFAMIGPACWLRPHLTPQLIRYPIEAIYAAGIDDPELAHAQGVARAKLDRGLRLRPEGKKWLLEVWPTLLPMVREVIADLKAERWGET